MTFKVVRDGDVNDAGGRAIATQRKFFVDGKAVVTDGSPVTPHRPCPKHGIHCAARTANGSKEFLIEGKPVNMVGNKDTCGHTRIQGSSNFLLFRRR